MDSGLYVAMSGSKENMLSQAVKANNIANANTPGFRADLSDQFSMPVYGDGLPTRVYSSSRSPATDFKPSSITTTGNDLDIAVVGDGFIAVIGPDGEESYTRRGDMMLSDDLIPVLLNGAGHRIQGNGGEISIPLAEKISIGKDGTVYYTPLGAEAGTVVEAGKIKLVNPDVKELRKNEYGTFSLINGGQAEEDAGVKVQFGGIENSNVNAVSELIDLISLARQHELDVKMMRSMEDNDQAMARIMQIG